MKQKWLGMNLLSPLISKKEVWKLFSIHFLFQQESDEKDLISWDDTMNGIYILSCCFLRMLEQHQLRLLGNVSGESIRRIIKIHHYCHFSYCFNMEQQSSGANTETSRNFIMWRVRIEEITVYKSVKKVCIKDFTIKQWSGVESGIWCYLSWSCLLNSVER